MRNFVHSNKLQNKGYIFVFFLPEMIYKRNDTEIKYCSDFVELVLLLYSFLYVVGGVL